MAKAVVRWSSVRWSSDKRWRRRTEQLAAAKAEEEATAEAEPAESAKAAQEVKTSATQPARQDSEGAARRSKYVRTDQHLDVV